MPDNWKEFPWILVILSAIAGMVGGCGSASFQVLSGRQLTIAIMGAYATLGAALGITSFLITFGIADLPVDKVLLIAIAMGGFSTATVAGVRVGVKAVLRWRGIEAEITLRRSDDKGRP